MEKQSADILCFTSKARVDAAWSEYQALAVRLQGNPELLADRSYNEAMARKHERWRRLFLAMEAA